MDRVELMKRLDLEIETILCQGSLSNETARTLADLTQAREAINQTRALERLGDLVEGR